MKLIVTATPAGYAVAGSFIGTDYFSKIEVLPYGADFPEQDENFMMIGNFNVPIQTIDPRKVYPVADTVDEWYYFPLYAPKATNRHVFFNKNVTPYTLMYAVLNKKFEQANEVFNNLSNALNAASGKGLYYTMPKYAGVVDVANKVLTYADLYKGETKREEINSILTTQHATTQELDMVLTNAVANANYWIQGRVDKAQDFTTPMHTDEGDKELYVTVVHSDIEMQKVALELARKAAPQHEYYLALAYKRNFVQVVSNVFEQIAPLLGKKFKYQGGQGVYSFFMQGMDDDTLYRAFKDTFEKTLGGE